eukprot:12076881-Ditylum_brightwellii.AAC.1
MMSTQTREDEMCMLTTCIESLTSKVVSFKQQVDQMQLPIGGIVPHIQATTNNTVDISNLQDEVLTEISSLCLDTVEQIEVIKIKEQLQSIMNFQQ